MERDTRIKLVIWDLDDTLWEGVLAEGGGRRLRPGAKDAVLELDRRGIVQSIVSKNERGPAMERLSSLGVAEYFLCPEISWGPKSAGVSAILSALNIKPEAAAFLDDSAFERDEVLHAHPRINVYGGGDVPALLALPAFQVPFITADSARRREMYRADLDRQRAEAAFAGSPEDFLASLDMVLDISPVTLEDIKRVEELTLRTHQLNATGYTYSFDELAAMIGDPRYIFLICGLRDRYGDSGKVGLLLLERGEALRIKLLIVSCRVMSRGVGTALLACATAIAGRLSLPLLAEFRETEHNRIMFITYRLSGFEIAEENGPELLLRYGPPEPLPLPDYLTVIPPPAAAIS